MKKIILLTSAILMISTVANACGGITIKSGKYCLSKHRMNWYSAYAWCQAQGMMMVDMESLCGSTSSCSALKLSEEEQNKVTQNDGITNEYVWLTDSVSTTCAKHVHLMTGAVGPSHHGGRSSGCGHGNGCIAICK